MLSREARTFIALSTAHLLVDCFGGIWPVYKKLAALDLVWAGVIATVTTTIGTACQPVFGLWADRGHRRVFVIWGSLLVFPAMLLGPLALKLPQWSLAAGYGAMFLVMLSVRVGQGIFHPAGSGVAGNFSPQRRATFFSIFIALGGLGYASSQWLFSQAWHLFGKHTEWLVLPGLALMAMVWWWCRPPDIPRESRPRFWAALAGLREARGPLLILFGILSMVAALNFGLHYLLNELCEQRGYPLWFHDGGGFLLLVLGSVIVMVPAGHLADRVGRKRMLVITLALSLVFYYALILIPRVPTPVFALLMLTAGAFIGTANPLGVSFGQHLAPHAASTISSLLMGLAWSLGSLSQVAMGFLADPDRLNLGFANSLLILGVVNLVAVGLALLLPKTDHAPGAAP